MYQIIESRQLTQNVISITINAPLVAKHAKAGQFVIIRPLAESERIPLTISFADSESGYIRVVFQPVGQTTKQLELIKQGEYITDVCGPLGNATKIESKRVCVIGGGVGCAIALPIAKAFKDSGAYVVSVIGFKNKDSVILSEDFKENCDKVVLVTDDGSCGQKGFVTNALEGLIQNGEKFDEVIAIGSLMMMKFVSQLTKKYSVKTTVSMNPIMIDGTGMCGGCRLTVDGEVKFACVDGPDFDGHKVDFDNLILRNSQYSNFERERREQTCNLLNKEIEND